MSNVIARGISSTLKETEKEVVRENIGAASQADMTAVEDDILINQAYVGGQTIATGSAVFNNADNSIKLTGIGIGVEVGDVITITGSVDNSKEFTVEEITNTGEVVVNKAHAGGTTTKSLTSETVNVTVKLLCKWYLAPVGLGQGWVNVTGGRLLNVDYLNTTGRSISIDVGFLDNNDRDKNLTINGVVVSGAGGTVTSNYASLSTIVTKGGIYRMSTVFRLDNWAELR